MLLQKNTIEKNDIVTFKTIGGEEIVGKYIETSHKGEVLINRPVILAVQMVGPQQAQLGFMPFMAATNDDFTVKFPEHALVTNLLKAKEDVSRSYINATSSIAVPTAKESGIILGT